MEKMKKDIQQIRDDVEYIKKIVEDLSLTIKTPKEGNDILNGMMDNFKTMINSDPNLKKRPDIKNTINNLFKVTP